MSMISDNVDQAAFEKSSRRDFLKSSVLAGLTVAFYVPESQGRLVKALDSKSAFTPNAFIHIAEDNLVTIFVKHVEMGQGVYTALPMIIAEELSADWQHIRVAHAPATPEYFHTTFGLQITGGSTSISEAFSQMRQAGAVAKQLLIQAAAQLWQVSISECQAKQGQVKHVPSGQVLNFGQLAAVAQTLPPVANVTLKESKDFEIIGQSKTRLDAYIKSTGQAEFGIDVKRPGMVYAVVARPAKFGATLQSFRAEAALALPGVLAVVPISRGLAVVAERFWTAKKARALLDITWDESQAFQESSAEETARYRQLSETPSATAVAQGDLAAAFDSAAQVIAAEYHFPYLAHATLEPLNCTAHVQGDRAEIWVGTQMQTVDIWNAAKAAGIAPEKITLNTVFLGGGFGRRANPASDFIVEAVEISKALQKPVKVIWTREDDMQGGFYRPKTVNLAKVALDAEGQIQGLDITVVGASIVEGTALQSAMMQGDLDHLMVEGLSELRDQVPNMRLRYAKVPKQVPVLWWRSVGHTYTAFIKECLIDECAVAAQQDAVAYRLKMLAEKPRERQVLAAVAAQTWQKNLPAGHFQGVAVHTSFNSSVAEIVELSVIDNKPYIHKITCAIDCGLVINPDLVKSQVESAVIFGLTAALYGEITFKGGQVEQGNFDDYPLLRLAETPKIDVILVKSELTTPTGVGEPGTPPVAAALANAWYAATGQRVYRLPL